MTSLEEVGPETKFHQPDFFYGVSCFASGTMKLIFRHGRASPTFAKASAD